MAIRARESSADSAARFLTARKRAQYRAPRRYRERTPPTAPLAPRRIALDFAEPTLQLIHDVLCEAIHARVFPDRQSLLTIAEHMVAAALGRALEFGPLDDRGVR